MIAAATMALSRKSRAAAVSVASNTALVVLKVVVGVVSQSVSVLSEAIHSANDLVAALIAFASTRVSDRPSDREHPYGYGKAESISGAVEAALIMLAALWIVVEAVRKLFHGGEVEHLGLGAAVMGVSALVNTVVSLYLFRVAKQEDSLALEADAHHLTTDVYTSAGVGAGLLVVWFTGWHVVDPLVAIAVALLIAHVGWKLTIQASGQLMDRSLPPAEVAEIEATLRADRRVLGFHRLRTRKSGSDRYVDAHVVLPAQMGLGEAHEVARGLEAAVERLFPRTHVVVHVDPDAVVSTAKDGR
jgi:cation diffusion facilitator family transporter